MSTLTLRHRLLHLLLHIQLLFRAGLWIVQQIVRVLFGLHGQLFTLVEVLDQLLDGRHLGVDALEVGRSVGVHDQLPIDFGVLREVDEEQQHQNAEIENTGLGDVVGRFEQNVEAGVDDADLAADYAAADC